VIAWLELPKRALAESRRDNITPRTLDFTTMPVEYVNRRDERYYLHQGKTRTGKPKYYFSRKPGGVPVEQVPDGYEIYEHPERGIVFIRKVRTSRVLPVEREMLARWTRELAGIAFFCVDVQEDSLVIYTASTDGEALVNSLSERIGMFPGREAAAREWIGKHATYLPMLRFTLVDEKKRLFAVERWCFRGSIDDWFFLAGPQPLETQAKKYLPHLNRESFFELM
jgi:hypothetical protein